MRDDGLEENQGRGKIGIFIVLSLYRQMHGTRCGAPEVSSARMLVYCLHIPIRWASRGDAAESTREMETEK